MACDRGRCRCLERNTETGSLESVELCIHTIDDRRAIAADSCDGAFEELVW